MKKLLFSLSLIGALAASAAESEIDASAQIFGCLPVTSSATNVIVSVPWVAATNGAETAISVSNIIKTANLTVGDTVKVYNRERGAFNVWTLAQNDGIKYWSGVTVVGTNGAAATAGADITTLARGGAMILTRKDPGTSDEPKTFYVYGQYTTASASEIVITVGTKAVPSYTLVAPPFTTSYDINDTGKIEFTYGNPKKGATDGDIVIAGQGGSGELTERYYLKTGKIGWGYSRGSEWKQPGDIPAGVGFWYVSRGGTQDSTKITFK